MGADFAADVDGEPPAIASALWREVSSESVASPGGSSPQPAIARAPRETAPNAVKVKRVECIESSLVCGSRGQRNLWTRRGAVQRARRSALIAAQHESAR